MKSVSSASKWTFDVITSHFIDRKKTKPTPAFNGLFWQTSFLDFIAEYLTTKGLPGVTSARQVQRRPVLTVVFFLHTKSKYARSYSAAVLSHSQPTRDVWVANRLWRQMTVWQLILLPFSMQIRPETAQSRLLPPRSARSWIMTDWFNPDWFVVRETAFNEDIYLLWT